MKRFRILVAILVLASCASHDANTARAGLIGRSYTEARTCLGFPARAETIEDGSMLAQWDYTEPGAGAALPLSDLAVLPITLPFALAGTVSVSGAGNCHAVAHIVDGRVATLIFTGASGGVSGPDAACRAIVRGCNNT